MSGEKVLVEPDQDTTSKLHEWSTKLAVPYEKLLKEYTELFNERKEKNLTMSDVFLSKRAKTILGAKYASELRSPAKPFVTYFFGVSELRDVAEYAVNQAKAAWMKAHAIKDDLQRASEIQKLIDDGIVDRAGVPLETREFFPETTRKIPGFGKPIEPFWQKTAVGVGRPVGKVADKPVALTLILLRLRLNQAGLEVPVGTPQLYRANVNEVHPNRLVLNSSVTTKFTDTIISELQGKSAVDILAGVPDELKSSPIDLEQWHDKHKDESMRCVFLTGDVIVEASEKTATGNYRLVLGDVEKDIEHRGTTCFVPAHYENILKQLGVGSKAVAAGMTALGMDMGTQERTQVNLNTWALVPIDIVEPSEEILTEETPDIDVA